MVACCYSLFNETNKSQTIKTIHTQLGHALFRFKGMVG